MKIILIIISILGVAVVILFQQKDIILDQIAEVASTKISHQVAIENIKKLPEVQQYLKDVPNGKVEVDNELEGEYNVHVYEVKNGHTATFNWYRVSIKSGEIRPEFEVEQTDGQKPQEQQSSKTSNSTSEPRIPAGTVSGKVCYPSEVIPKGKLEVKRLMDGYTFSENYPGSLKGVEPTYSCNGSSQRRSGTEKL
ncbi:hypothetical protein HYU93_03170 [Candidatus Daviesbacteria bacterium]|nr:hypothetical protein [Candidatus Daviesbacteria bacterium]